MGWIGNAVELGVLDKMELLHRASKPKSWIRKLSYYSLFALNGQKAVTARQAVQTGGNFCGLTPKTKTSNSDKELHSRTS